MDYSQLDKLDAEIAELKQRIAERDAKRVPQPKTKVGWASYIMNDDPHLLDMYQNAERQWNQMQEQNKLTREISDANRAEQQMYATDDNMKNRSHAAINFEYARQALEGDNSNDPRIEAQLQQNLDNALVDYNYWNKRLGYKEVKYERKKKAAEGASTKAKTVDYSGITSFDTEADKQKTLNEIETNPAFNTDEALRAQYVRLKGIKSKEQSDREQNEAKAKWRKEYNSLTSSRQREWKKNNPDKAKAIGV